MPSLSRQLGWFASDLTHAELPEVVVDRLKGLLLHSLAIALVGRTYPVAARTIAFVQREEAVRYGGSRVLVDGTTVTKMGAAYANSLLMHVTGQSDSYLLFTHPGLTVIPAALAIAVAEGSSGRELLASLAAGYEVLVRIARDALPSTQAAGFRSGPVYGGAGAAVAAAKLMRLGGDGIADAIAHWVSVAAGNLEGARSGGHETVLHEPTAARNGVLAALQARDGFRGGETVLEGPAGFYRAYARMEQGRLAYDFGNRTQVDLGRVAADLGSHWEMTEVIQKAYSTSGYNQPLVDVAARLAREHVLKAAEIERVEVEMNWLETLYPSPAFTASASGPGRKSSEYFCAWGFIAGGYPRLGRPIGHMSGLDEGDQIDPPSVIELMQRVAIEGSKQRRPMSPRVVVHTARGRFEATATGEEFKWGLRETLERSRELVPGMVVSERRFGQIARWVDDIESARSTEPLIGLTIPDEQSPKR